MDLSIIIVNYQSRDKLLRCLASLRRVGDEGLHREIIIIDNNSGDILDDILITDPSLKLIISPKNLGMGGGNNLGLEAAQGEFILILNPDTVLQSDTISVMLKYLRDNPEVGLIGPKLLNPDGSLQFSCRRWPSIFLPILRRTALGKKFVFFKKSVDKFLMTDFAHDQIKDVDWLLGSCLLTRREFLMVNGEIFKPRFDERYFMYFEDTDLARQMWSRGLRVVYHPGATLVHDHQRQSARYPWYLAPILDSLAREHIISWCKYFTKWSFKPKTYAKD